MRFSEVFDLECERLCLWQTLCEDVKSRQQSIITDRLTQLKKTEHYYAYPGQEVMLRLYDYLTQKDFYAFELLARNVLHSLETREYRKQEFIPFYTNLTNLDKPQISRLSPVFARDRQVKKQKVYFEVLIVHPEPQEYELYYRNTLAGFKSPHDSYIYDFVMVNNYEDALIAVLSNPAIQVCIYLSGIKSCVDRNSRDNPELVDNFISILDRAFYGVSNSRAQEQVSTETRETEFVLKETLQLLRPELDHFFITESPLSEPYYNEFERVFTGFNLFADLHQHIITAVEQRCCTPFFDALRNYASKPKGAFHALPISQGQSITNSLWINDVMDFYGENIFAAETSSTLGGMDSLMDPKGSISQAQNRAARAFKSQYTYFVTNGTTTANKIVMQANLQPDDVVLISSDCHKSIPYSVFLSGANAVFLETYPLNQYDLYGCVTLERIKEVLMDLKQQNQLHRVRQITLTNSTFDGIIYNVKRFMLDILAIKPDIIFHWDEAWFSFGAFNPLYLNRTAMGVANELDALRSDPAYAQFYRQWLETAEPDNPDYVLNNPLYPDPEELKIRVYATQSTHKTLTAFRQTSMLHIFDHDLDRDNFHEAYRTHTTTSPNYQLIASLDFARRQMVLEGFERVKKTIELACYLRRTIKEHELLCRYFKVLEDEDLIPVEYQSSSESELEQSHSHSSYHYIQLLTNFHRALFNVDPTRVTLDISATGIDGPNFRQMLMTQYDVQVNKTSRNTILLIINIGASMDNITYLLEALIQIASKLSQASEQAQTMDKPAIINLPQTRLYHKRFISVASLRKNNFQAINIRSAYYAGLKGENVDFVTLSNELMSDVINDKKLISASFVTPYPPGFPIIVPGQIINYDLLLYLQTIQIKEIHGYHPEKGLKIFTENYLSS